MSILDLYLVLSTVQVILTSSARVIWMGSLSASPDSPVYSRTNMAAGRTKASNWPNTHFLPHVLAIGATQIFPTSRRSARTRPRDSPLPCTLCHLDQNNIPL
ncbi:hypothetical protein J6590_067072 [Homalodisca vitripennis]|nr:hypothetical protein J6590_067072 [Homalodisca vitripennis]